MGEPGKVENRRTNAPEGLLSVPSVVSARSRDNANNVQNSDVPGEFPNLTIDKASEAAKSDIKTTGSQQIDLHELADYVRQHPEAVQYLSMNQAKQILAILHEDLQKRGYNPRERVLGFGTESDNPNNPFVIPGKLYNPVAVNDRLRPPRVSEEQQRSSAGTGLPQCEIFEDPKEKPRVRFGLDRVSSITSEEAALMDRRAREAITLANSTPEQQRQNEQRESVELATYRDPHMRDPRSLDLRLRVPANELTERQTSVYRSSIELQNILRSYDQSATHSDNLQSYYQRNGWSEDSRWFGVDDQKFLAEIRSKNEHNAHQVSYYDKFRVLQTVDRIREQNPEIFTTVDRSKLSPIQLEMRKSVEQLEHDTRAQLAMRVRNEVTKLQLALSKQQDRQGVVSSGADAVIGVIGKPGGWGGMFMDSDATSRSTRENLEKARLASQNLLALSDFSGSNAEFTRAYQERTGALKECLSQTNENLKKLAEAQSERAVAISEITQVVATLGVSVACASAAPETFGGSLALIPVLTPAVTGSFSKISIMASEGMYTVPELIQDGLVAGVSSATLPGVRLAAPLLRARTAAEIAKATMLQRARRAGAITVGSAIAGGVDGGIVEATRAAVHGENPVAVAGQGVIGGSIMGAGIGPAMHLAGRAVQRGLGKPKPSAAEASPHANLPSEHAPRVGRASSEPKMPNPLLEGDDISWGATELAIPARPREPEHGRTRPHTPEKIESPETGSVRQPIDPKIARAQNTEHLERLERDLASDEFMNTRPETLEGKRAKFHASGVDGPISIELPTREQLLKMPMAELQQWAEANKQKLLSLVEANHDKIPYLAFNGSTKEKAEHMVRNGMNTDSGGVFLQLSTFWRKSKNPRELLADSTRAVAYSERYTNNSRIESMPSSRPHDFEKGPILVMTPRAPFVGANGRLRFVDNQSNAASDTQAGIATHWGHSGTRVGGLDRPSHVMLGAISPRVGATYNIPEAIGLEGNTRLQLITEIRNQHLVLEALKIAGAAN
jgi:hypothetical protein